jgi:hypothetical protein
MAARPVRFTTDPLSIGGVAYDSVSERFVIADRREHKLVSVDERSGHADDLVRSDSAGFLDLSAVEIDERRGDLWVTSAASAEGPSALHRLQLVSGRPLRAFHAAAGLEPVTFVDLSVTPDGDVLVLDPKTPQLLVLRRGADTLEGLARLEAVDPVSVAAGPDGVAFVANRDGILRVNVRSRTVARLPASPLVQLDHLERVRWRENAVIAVRVNAAGSREVLRIQMNATGTAITGATRLELAEPIAANAFMTISGDQLVYLAGGSDEPSGASGASAALVAYRFSLR